MSNEMIERVANCIYPNAYGIECDCSNCVRYKIIAKEAARIKAKEIIAAMRDPTEEMFIRGSITQNLDPMPIDRCITMKEAINIYQAMIDAALKED